MDQLKKAGIWLVGMDDKGEQTLYQVDLTIPVAIAMGAEGTGLRRLSKEKCDFLVKLPMTGVVESLNVSVAAGICLYEAMRQRNFA
jgi:23S rRNA (guanosine2251-2'-O)-methyltransferase